MNNWLPTSFCETYEIIEENNPDYPNRWHLWRPKRYRIVRRATGGYLGNRVIEVMMPHITYERDAAEIYLRQYRGEES